jgi:hypothetical protein
MRAVLRRLSAQSGIFLRFLLKIALMQFYDVTILHMAIIWLSYAILTSLAHILHFRRLLHP